MANNDNNKDEQSTKEELVEDSDAQAEQSDVAETEESALDESSDTEDSEVSDDDEVSDDAEASEETEETDETEESDDEDDASETDSDDEASQDSDDESEESDDESEESDDSVVAEPEVVDAGDGDDVVPPAAADPSHPEGMKGMAAFFDVPDDLMVAAAHTRDSDYEDFDAFSPFPIHGMDEAMGIGRSWIPWVTFGAGVTGFMTAVTLQFGTMTFDWPMMIGGKSYAPWPAFVPIMFELTVLLAGCITAAVMLVAAGCFKKPFIIDPELTKDRFALWISSDDEAFDPDEVRQFMETLDPVEIRTITKGA